MSDLVYGLCQYGDPDQPHVAVMSLVGYSITTPPRRWWRPRPRPRRRPVIRTAACELHVHLAVRDNRLFMDASGG